MRHLRRPPLPMLVAFALLLGLAPSLQAPSACTSEVLRVRATPLTLRYCVEGRIARTPGGEISVPVWATYATATATRSQHVTLRFIAAEGPALVLQSIPLARLGIVGTLHLTLRFDGSAVRIQSAMLTPGAITIK